MLHSPWRSKVCVCVIFMYIFFQNLKSLTWHPLITSQTALEKFCLAMPPITELIITEVNYDDKCDGLLSAIAANLHELKYLEISDSDVDPKAIEYLLPTDDNTLGGCSELVHLDLMGVEDVDEELLKKILLSLPKLRSLTHELLVNALGNLTEEEMGVDTARYLSKLYARNTDSPTRFDLLAKSPAFERLKNNITTVDLDVPIDDEEQQETTILADVLMCMPKLNKMGLNGISEAHHVSSLLEFNGDRLEDLTFLNFHRNLSVQDIMRACSNLVRLFIYYSPKEDGPLIKDSNRHQDQVEMPSKLLEFNCLTDICLYDMDTNLCSADMLRALLQSTNLKAITLMYVEAMSDDVMFNALSSRGCTALSKVTKLVLKGCPLITEAPFVQWLSRDNCSLQDLFVNDCENVDYQRLRDAAAKCPRTMIIKRCRE